MGVVRAVPRPTVTGVTEGQCDGQAFAAVTAAAVVVAVAVSFFLSLEVEAPQQAGRPVVGHEEPVVVAPVGLAAEAAGYTATVDPAIDRSSISRDVADALGLDLTDAPVVTVVSAFGTQERPVTSLVVTLGDRERTIEATVAPRDELSAPVLVGRDLLAGLLVDPDATMLTTPDSRTAGFVAEALDGRADPVSATTMLALLPVGALVIVVLRYVVGVSTLGTFAPVLVAVAFLQTGVVPTLVTVVGVTAIGLVLEPVLHRWRVPRVARLAVLIGLASLALLVTARVVAVGAVASWGAAFPLIVSAGLVEQLYDVVESDGTWDAIVDGVGTVVVALLTVPILVAEPVRALGRATPWLVVVVATVLSVAAGSYRGLRLTELVRFRGAARRHGAPV